MNILEIISKLELEISTDKECIVQWEADIHRLKQSSAINLRRMWIDAAMKRIGECMLEITRVERELRHI